MAKTTLQKGRGRGEQREQNFPKCFKGFIGDCSLPEGEKVIGQMLNSIWSINNLVFFNDQCDYVTSTFKGQLQAMTRDQFDKTSKKSSVRNLQV